MHADRIRSDTTFGPFCVIGETVYDIAGEADKYEGWQTQYDWHGFLACNRCKNSLMIRCWDALGRQSTGICGQFVRQAVVNLRSWWSSGSLLFVTVDFWRFRFDDAMVCLYTVGGNTMMSMRRGEMRMWNGSLDNQWLCIRARFSYFAIKSMSSDFFWHHKLLLCWYN